MNTRKQVRRKKRMYSPLFTICLSLLAMCSVLIASFQVEAWFKNFETAKTNAVLTNFETKVEYSTGSAWKTLSAGESIPVVIESGVIKLDKSRITGLSTAPSSLQIRITYRGKSSAYLRTSVNTVFQNKNTATILPKLNLSITGSNWITSGDYIYFTKICGDEHDGSITADKYVESHPLDVFTVSLNSSNPSISNHQDYKGDLYIVVDTVQPDRYNAFWGLSALPF